MANKRRGKKTGRFINNVVRVEEAKQIAENYYERHKKTIDKILQGRTKRIKQDFVGAVEDLFEHNRSKYNSKKNLTEGIKQVINEFQGIDPRLNEIKREAAFREEAGFKDLRKLNKRLQGQEITYEGPNGIIGYYDITGSDYVIVHRLDYQFSEDSPQDVYEYETRINAGLGPDE